MSEPEHTRAPSGRRLHPLVVCISGPSGGGKSTLLGRLAAYWPETRCLFFDDPSSGLREPADLRAWVDAGADPAAWTSPGLEDTLRTLRTTSNSTAPSLVLLEEPFGRARPAIAPYVDLVLHLDTPLAIAFARRLARYWAREPPLAAEQLAAFVAAEIRGYLLGDAHAVQAVVRDLARRSADVVLDGTAPLDHLVELARAAIDAAL